MLKVGVPSSTVMPDVYWMPATVTVYPPVASLPALNTALLPLMNVSLVDLPVARVSQFAVVVFQVPSGLLPAPAFFALRSQ